MEVSVDLNVSKEDFFDFLYESIIKDIKDGTGRMVARRKVVKGYTYDKIVKNKKGKPVNMKIKIAELEPFDEYTAEIRTKQGKNFVSYIVEDTEDVEDIDEEKIRVTYKEGYEAPGMFKKINYTILKFMHKKGLTAQAKSNLIDIETYIKNSKVKA